MQINKEKALFEFNSFINSIKNKNNYNNIKLASFAFQIPEFEIVNLISSDLVLNNDSFYWKINQEKIEFLSAIPLISFNEFGEERLSRTKTRITKLEQFFISNWSDLHVDFFPLVVGGIKFAPNQIDILWSDYSDSDWFIPKITFYSYGDDYYLVYNFLIDKNLDKCTDVFSFCLNEIESTTTESIKSDLQLNSLKLLKETNFEEWETVINKALKNISEGYLSKVVLSREVTYQLNNDASLVSLVKLLSQRYPKCYTFLFNRNNSFFIGSSPEKLARVSNSWIEVDALAGSIPRGETPEEDKLFEEELLKSEKNLFEQRAVVHFINNLLEKFAEEIIFSDQPQIRKLPNIQHLWTIMRARIKDDIKMLDILTSLHPTPAICGDPWKSAMDFILENESHCRGLYSGNVGWFNFNGFGEFAVAIRSALIKNSILSAYAGCGIVEGSEPKAEFTESEIKLKPILTLFADEKVCQS